MTTQTRQSVLLTGLATVYTACQVGGDDFVNDSADGARTFVVFKNATAAAITVTVVDQTSVAPPGASAFTPSVAVVVPATTGERWIGPLGSSRFNAPATGKVSFVYSAVGLSMAVVNVP